MKTHRLRTLEKAARRYIKPRPGGALRIVWIDTETGKHTINGETMTRAEYRTRYPRGGPVLKWPENEGEL